MTELGVPAGAELWVLLASVPLAVAGCTSFTKIAIVLGSLRAALGARELLPLSSLIALAAVLTALVMAPVGGHLADELAVMGTVEGLRAGDLLVWARAFAPLREFMLAHADPEALDYFAQYTGLGEQHPLVVIGGFMIGELAEAFALVTSIALAFMVVDLVVGQLLALLGHQQTATASVATPVKLLVFVGTEGWLGVVSGIVESYSP